MGYVLSKCVDGSNSIVNIFPSTGNCQNKSKRLSKLGIQYIESRFFHKGVVRELNKQLKNIPSF